MQDSEFTNPSGRIGKTLTGHGSFIPSPLSPTIDFNAVLGPLTDCIQAIGELRGAAKRTENPLILIEPLQRREALTTSAMEGTFTTAEELAVEQENISAQPEWNARETANFIEALRHAVASLPQLSISQWSMKDAHRRLLAGLPHNRGASKNPGEFKSTQNWIGAREIQYARYVPPGPLETKNCMDELESYINRPQPELFQKVTDLALVHYQFEAIHPFSDGNGRIGRLLITLMSIHSGLFDLPLLLLSPFLEKHKADYIDRMHAVSAKSEWPEWLDFFFRAITESCKETVAKIDQLLALQKEFKQRAARIGRSSKLTEAIDMLFHSPIITVPKMMERYQITYRAAQMIIEKLITVGILTERKTTFPKYFVASEIISAISSD